MEEFELPISAWMRLFDEVGFDVEGFHEIQAPATAEGSEFSVPADWARRVPAEQAWGLVKR